MHLFQEVFCCKVIFVNNSFSSTGGRILFPCQELTADLIYKLVEKDLVCKVILGFNFSLGMLC